MSYHDDLLEQARHLVGYEPRRPRQASLRRAISAAYYAAFHLLLDAAGRAFVPGASRAAERELLRRSIDHGSMKAACQERSWWPRPVPPDLEIVLRLFPQLQDARQKADYALHGLVTRADTLAVIADT
jgi:hypothetical protein